MRGWGVGGGGGLGWMYGGYVTLMHSWKVYIIWAPTSRLPQLWPTNSGLESDEYLSNYLFTVCFYLSYLPVCGSGNSKGGVNEGATSHHLPLPPHPHPKHTSNHNTNTKTNSSLHGSWKWFGSGEVRAKALCLEWMCIRNRIDYKDMRFWASD